MTPQTSIPDTDWGFDGGLPRFLEIMDLFDGLRNTAQLFYDPHFLLLWKVGCF